MLVESECKGLCHVALTFDGGAEMRWMHGLFGLGLAAMAALAVAGVVTRGQRPR
jgi:hypothetical protein